MAAEVCSLSHPTRVYPSWAFKSIEVGYIRLRCVERAGGPVQSTGAIESLSANKNSGSPPSLPDMIRRQARSMALEHRGVDGLDLAGETRGIEQRRRQAIGIQLLP